MDSNLKSQGYGMYGKIYICPSCGKKVYLKEIHNGKCEHCLNPNNKHDSIL